MDGRKHVALSLRVGLLLAAGLLGLSAEGFAGTGSSDRPLVVGWRDELGDESEKEWRWALPAGGADTSFRGDGLLRLRIGDQSVLDRADPARPYYWATVSRHATVDLDRYPILAVRTVRLEPRGSWWDCFVREYQGGESYGREVAAAVPDARLPGLLLFDVAEKLGLSGLKTLRIRLNVASPARDARVDYDYVRFIRREDIPWLQENPTVRSVLPSP